MEDCLEAEEHRTAIGGGGAEEAQLLLARHEGHLAEFNFLEWTLRAANTFFHNKEDGEKE